MSNDLLATVKMPAFVPRPAANRVAPAEQKDSAPPQVEAEKLPDIAEVTTAARAIESYLRSNGRELEFRVDDASGQMVVSVRDAATGDLIRQVPGEAVLRMARALKEDSVSLVSVSV
jgi:flagellar protein FlaG